MEDISRELIEDARRLLATTSPIHRCPYCRQYACDCPERRLAEDSLTGADTDGDEEELKLSGEQDEVIINPEIEKGAN